jgi:hypothetical protein
MIYATQPWKAGVKTKDTVVEAYVEAAGAWETVAIARPSSGASAKQMARFIVGLVNEKQKQAPLMEDALAVLECVSKEGLTTLTTGEAVEHVIGELRKRRGYGKAALRPVDRMVAAIVAALKSSGSCEPHELKEQGFSREEIARHWPMAYALACVSQNITPKDS